MRGADFVVAGAVGCARDAVPYPGCDTWVVTPRTPEESAPERVKFRRRSAEYLTPRTEYLDVDDPDAYVSSCSVQ